MCGNDRFQKMKMQKDDTSTQSQSKSRSTGHENMDINANRKKCSCELLETELNHINKLTRQALSTIHSNEYKCTKCGGNAQRISQKSK